MDGAADLTACGNEEGAKALVEGDEANRRSAAKREKAGMLFWGGVVDYFV